MQCSRCKVFKDQDDFEPGKTKCKSCRAKLFHYYEQHRDREIARATASQNKDRQTTNEKKRARNRKNSVSYILCGIKSRAKRRGIPFDLSHEDIVIPTHCPVLGIPLMIGDGTAGDNSPSVDRIIPNLGYVKGNIRIVSHRANTIRSNASIDELKMLVTFLEGIK